MRPTPTIDLHLLLMREHQILLLLRSGTGFEDGKYSVVAGHLEVNESLSRGLCREAYEEVGVEIAEQDLSLVHVMHNRSGNDRLAFFFSCKRWRGTASNREPEKCAGLRWATYAQAALIDNQVGYIRAALSHIENSVLYSSYGDWDVHSTGQ